MSVEEDNKCGPPITKREYEEYLELRIMRTATKAWANNLTVWWEENKGRIAALSLQLAKAEQEVERFRFFGAKQKRNSMEWEPAIGQVQGQMMWMSGPLPHGRMYNKPAPFFVLPEDNKLLQECLDHAEEKAKEYRAKKGVMMAGSSSFDFSGFDAAALNKPKVPTGTLAPEGENEAWSGAEVKKECPRCGPKPSGAEPFRTDEIRCWRCGSDLEVVG